jgi:hypothetical protein
MARLEMAAAAMVMVAVRLATAAELEAAQQVAAMAVAE